MAEFNLDFNETKRQLSYANLTDLQILELIKTLQTKRTTKDGVSSKYLDYYLSLFYWKEKNKDLTYQEQAYEIINLLSEQVKKIPLHKFSGKKIAFDLKGILGKNEGYAVAN